MFETVLKTITVLVGVGGLVIGFFQYTMNQSVEASKPFLQRKLAWCEEATNLSARIAVAENPAQADKDRFWLLYWGELGLVEGKDVEDAMHAFGDALQRGESPASVGGGKAMAFADPDRPKHLGDYALAIAHACRDELARDWSPIWDRALR